MSALAPVWAHLPRIGFERPLWLLLLLAVPVVFWVARRSLADFSPAQRAGQAVVRALLFAGVAAALGGAGVRRTARAVSAVALLDVSDSVSDEGLNLERRVARTLIRTAAQRGLPAPRLVRFAARPEETPVGEHGEIALERFAPPGGEATDLSMAVGLGAGLVDPAGLPRLLLVSDGRATRADLAGAAARLGERGVPIYAMALPPPPADHVDVAIAALDAPESIRPRVPFRLEARLLADRPTRARVHFAAAGHATIDQPDQAVALQAGATTVAATVRLTDSTDVILQAKVTAETDRHPENDRGVLAIAPERPPRALCLEGAPGHAGSLARALASQQIPSDVRRATTFGAGGELASYDLLVLADVPRAALSQAGLASIDRFVHGGGGLLVAGGTQSFGPGGYAGSPLEALLPVRLDVPDREEEAALALALVIDRSGSMAGAKIELTKQAAKATAEALPADDQIAVIVFDSQATPVVALQRAANRQRILSDIDRIETGGGTNILVGLREAVDELLPARARKKHVIVLSDGQSPYAEIPDLVDAAAAARITISAVGVGDGADQTMLKMIAVRGGGRFYHTRDPESIPRIFSRETSDLQSPSLVDRPTAVRVQKKIAALDGVDIAGAPALGGYVATRPRAQAETVLVTPDGAPLYARWSIGLGQVAAWTSDLGARWGAAWARWPSFDKLWAQLVRATLRARPPNHFVVKSARRDDQVLLAVDAIGADDRLLGGLDGRVEVTEVGADGRMSPRRALPLVEALPGRYEASFRPDLESGALLFRATFTEGGRAVADATGRASLPFAPELLPSLPGDSTGPASLADAAARSGGRMVDDAAEILAAGTERRETRQPLRTPILLTVLALFVVDVFLRRIRLPDATPRRRTIDSRR